MTKAKSDKKFQMDMCNGPILSKMLRFTLPLIAAGLLQLMFNAADIIVVGKFCGDNSMGAVGSNGSMVSLMTNFFIGISVGTNVLAARFFGAKNDEELSKTVHTSMMVSLIIGIFLTFVGLIGAHQILIWMKTPDGIIGLSTIYLRIYFLGMTATTVYNFGSALLRAIGDTQRPLIYLSISGVVNVVLNVIFVVVFKLDVAGVGIATVISQILSAVLVVRCLLRETGGIKLDLKKLKIDKQKLWQIIQIGLPAGIQGTLFSLSNVVIQSSINLFGDTVVSGNAAAANLESFGYVAMNAFYQAVISFTSQNFAQRNYKRIIKIMLIGQACVCVTGLISGGLMVCFGEELLWIYSDTEVVVAAGLTRLKYVITLHFLCGMMDCFVGSLRGIGYSFAPMIVSLIGACGLRLVWVYTVFQIPQFHMIETVYISYPITWFITGLTHAICFFILMRRVKRKYPPFENQVEAQQLS
ncbi:MAG: MATE family efflux transporter [Clostridiales bacterium]|nr:MATE family efflux transporter [Clostridiales bacterium]